MIGGSFSWRRGALHAVIPLVVILAFGGVMIATDRVKDVEKFTNGITRFTIFSVLAAFGISGLIQTGRKALGYAICGALVVLVAVLVIAAVVSRPDHQPLTAAGRAPLVAIDEGGHHRLQHPYFLFSILDPGDGFVPSDSMAEEMSTATAGDTQTVSYGYLKGSVGAAEAALVVTVYDDMGSADLRTMIDGASTVFLRKVPGAKITKTEVLPREAHFEAAVGDAAQIRIYAYAAERGDQPYVVSLTTFTRDPSMLVDVLASFKR